VSVDVYASAGPFTELTGAQAEMVGRLALDQILLCLAAQRLLLSPPDAFGAGLSEQRMTERNTRPASALLHRLLELEDAPLDHTRSVEHRVVGTCRHYAVLATAFLRAKRIPARSRCGFATYFIPGKAVDHWIVEYWSVEGQRWIRADPEYVGRATPGQARPDDLRPGEFLTAGEAWLLVRSGERDPVDFGVFGTENWGPGEVRGNAMRDLASLVGKIEMLPWDEWGPMEDSYNGTTGDDFDLLMDELAATTRDDDQPLMQRVYEQLAVPASMIR
jgi:hypothetical protein